MTIRQRLNSIAEKRILILDGAMGSFLQNLKLSEEDYRGSLFKEHPAPLKNYTDLLCLTKPDAIASVHGAYLEAGADIIETCSFNSTSISLSDYGLSHIAYEISYAAAQIARKAADKYSTESKPRFVAGSMGPTSKGASLYTDITDPGKRSICWDELEAAYYDNARGLLDGGTDILLIETIIDTLNAKAALFAVNRLLEERQADVPVIVSAAVSGDAMKLLSGQGLEAFCASVAYMLPEPWAIGINCSFGARKMLPLARLLSEIVPCNVCVYPNAGLPDSSGSYTETPQMMSSCFEEYFKEGLVNIAGGCCGSSPEHIAAMAIKAAAYAPRKLPDKPALCRLSGLEPLRIEEKEIEDILIKSCESDSAERQEMLELIAKGEYEDAADLARDMIENGAKILIIEIDDESALEKFLDYALINPYIAKAPFFISSARIETIITGLKRLQGRSLAGPVNTEEARLIEKYGAVPVVLKDDKKSVSCNY